MNVTVTIGQMQKLPTMERIQALQAEVAKYPQLTLEPEHFFAPGMYGRRLDIPAGSVVVGKVHRHDHLVMLMQGKAEIATPDGQRVTVKGPSVWVSKAGTKRAIYTHTDCAFFTTHATDETDLAKIEEYVIVPEIERCGYHTEALQGVYA